MNWFLMGLILCAGAALAIQAAINATLGAKIENSTQAVTISFLIGTLTMILFCIVQGFGVPATEKLRLVPWWGWFGGALGAFYLCCSIIVVPKLGIAMTLMLVVAGQMVGSLVIDHFGWLGMPERPVNLGRILGLALVVIGVIVMTVYRE